MRAVDDRWLAAGGFGLTLALAVALAATPDATGYEISIYRAYPWYVWALSVSALLVGSAVVVRSAATGTAAWRYGLLLLLTVVGLLVFLPFVRGYAVFGRADVLSHVGFIRDVVTTGHVSDGNIYPNLHLLALTLAYVTGVAPSTALMALAGVGSLFGVVSLVALLWAALGRRQALLAAPFAVALIAVQSVPYVFSSLLVPFVLYLFVRERRTRTRRIRAALVLALFALVIYHPITALFVVLVVAVYGVARWLHRHGVLSGTDGTIGPVGTVPLSQLVVAVFAIWYLDFGKIVERIGIVATNLAAPGGGSSIQSYSATVAQYSPALGDVFRIAALRYGPAAVLLPVGGYYALTFVADTLRGRDTGGVVRSAFVGAFALFTGLSALFFVVDMLVGFGRPLVYAELFGVALAGAWFHRLRDRLGSPAAVHAVVYVAVACLLVTTVFGLYASPLTVGENQQVTESELAGSEWYLDHRDRQDDLAEFGVETYRFRDAIHGRDSYGDEQVVTSDTERIPRGFGYAGNETLGASYTGDTYLILTEAGRQFYPGIYPDYRGFWKFEPAEFDRLARDPTVSAVYDNGEYDVYRVNATG